MYSTKIKRDMTQFGRLRTKCPTLGFLIRKTLCRLCGQVPALTPSPCPSLPPVVTIFIELCGCGQEHLLCLPLITQEISINPSLLLGKPLCTCFLTVESYLHTQTVHLENMCFPYKSTLMFQKRHLTPQKTQCLPSVYSYLESLLLSTPFLVPSPSKFPEGMWLSALFHIHQHFFGLQSASSENCRGCLLSALVTLPLS
uniref:Uncharacterized protein n=1 Tax=Pipistrellus kuhlii TaxID=59472 RepID=A0A7J7VUY6_PIPKU|nr:hypothetical protein mPipKuh1_008291 [Pipistrellus kuhlii]